MNPALGLGGRPEGLDLLCISAHADDVEIGAGGTVLLLIHEQRISSVTWVVLSGTPDREIEARASARAFLDGGPEPRILVQDFPESYFPSEASRIKDFFEELGRETNPDLILTHRREDIHQDHRVAAELTWNTFRNHLVLEYEIPKYDADLGSPNVFVELPAWAMERKEELIIANFPSQASRDWFDRETFRGLARIRGLESRVSSGYAEGLHGRKLVLGTKAEELDPGRIGRST